MTIPELPPLPLEWHELPPPGRWAEIMVPASVGVLNGWGNIARAARQGDVFVASYCPFVRNQLGPYPSVELDETFPDRESAKAAAEKAAQAEWKRFLAQLYTPHDPIH